MREDLSLRLSEADTRAHFIDPILGILGYRAVGDIRREVPVPATKEYLDYELRVAGKPQVIVEAKALRQPIIDQHAAQCVQYASVLGVRWCLITNGITWVVYNAHARGPLADKKVAVVHLDGDEQATTEAWSVLSLFSRDALALAAPLTRLLTECVVADELKRPDSPAIAALRRAVKNRFGEQVPAQTVIDAIHRIAVGSVAAVVPAAVETAASPRLRPVATRLSSVSDSGRVQLVHLVAAGLLPEDAVLECTLYGVTHTARVRDGRIEVEGRVYPTPSAAAGALRNGKATNCWIVWRHKGLLLADLRNRLPDTVASPAPAHTE